MFPMIYHIDHFSWYHGIGNRCEKLLVPLSVRRDGCWCLCLSCCIHYSGAVIQWFISNVWRRFVVYLIQNSSTLRNRCLILRLTQCNKYCDCMYLSHLPSMKRKLGSWLQLYASRCNKASGWQFSRGDQGVVRSCHYCRLYRWYWSWWQLSHWLNRSCRTKDGEE